MTSVALSQAVEPRRLLHVGCGDTPLPEWFPDDVETRLDISPEFNPDIVASMTDLGNIGPFDIVYTCHALEHIYSHEVPVALGEFYRVLAPSGVVMIIVPDLEDVQATFDVLYDFPGGGITGFDLYYGYRPMVATMPFMAHHGGFVADTLREALVNASFVSVMTKRLDNYNLLGVGIKP
jgi:predicted SAM-dependent methyltransferase